jgi:hypothetical protein
MSSSTKKLKRAKRKSAAGKPDATTVPAMVSLECTKDRLSLPAPAKEKVRETIKTKAIF